LIVNLNNTAGEKLQSDYYTTILTLTPIADGQVLNPFKAYSDTAYTYAGTAYIGNMEYSIHYSKGPGQGGIGWTYSNVISPLKMYTAEGFVDNIPSNMVALIKNGARYNYYRQDHLGNNREVWNGVRKNYYGTTLEQAATRQRTQYYPSGLPWASNAVDYPSAQSHKYNGKEFVEMHGLDTYDYGARGYYPASGRFMTVDPLAEKDYSISPYAYCAGNPVNRIDIDGKEIYFITRNSNGNVTNQLSYHNGNFWHENGSRYNPGKESLSKSLYKTLAVYRGIEKSGDKVLIHQLKTLETSKKNHFVEAGNNGSGVVPYDGPNKDVPQTDKMVNNGTPVGTQTTLDFSDETKKKLSDNNKGIPFSDADQVTHEMQHQYDNDQGTNADFSGDNSAKDPAEIRGVKNENRERKREGVHERTTYGGEEIDPNKLK